MEKSTDPVDLLDPSIARSVVTSNNARKTNAKGVSTSEDGKYIFEEKEDNSKKNTNKWKLVHPDQEEGKMEDDLDITLEDLHNARAMATGKKMNKRRMRDDFKEDDEEKEKEQEEGEGEDQDNKNKNNNNKNNNNSNNYSNSKKKLKGADGKGNKVRNVHSGENFKSSKAGGDVKRKGARVDPYAYLPLDPKLLNRRYLIIHINQSIIQSIYILSAILIFLISPHPNQSLDSVHSDLFYSFYSILFYLSIHLYI